jgi:hypothetical protein
LSIVTDLATRIVKYFNGDVSTSAISYLHSIEIEATLRMKLDLRAFFRSTLIAETLNALFRHASGKAPAAVVWDANQASLASFVITRAHQTFHRRHVIRTQTTAIRNAVIAAASAIVRLASRSGRTLVDATRVHKAIHWGLSTRANRL